MSIKEEIDTIKRLGLSVDEQNERAILGNQDTVAMFIISHPDWNGGKEHRVDKTVGDARRLKNLSGYKIRLDLDQIKPPPAYTPRRIAKKPRWEDSI